METALNLIKPQDIDQLLRNHVAITISQELESTIRDGNASRVFPATFARADGEGSDYAIDELKFGEHQNRALIDSVSSQAKRMTLRLLRLNQQSNFLPRITLQIEGQDVPISKLGHRICDGALVFSSINGKPFRQSSLGQALAQFARAADASELGVYAPESLLFGFWDSRGENDGEDCTKAKAARAIRSEIYAYDVDRVHTGATYRSVIESGKQLFPDLEGVKFSEHGLDSVPSSANTKAGVVTTKPILRTTTINLTAIRQIRCLKQNGKVDEAKSNALRRYLVALALVATGLDEEDLLLRSGAQLLLRGDGKITANTIRVDQVTTVTTGDVVALANQAADEWRATAGISEPINITYNFITDEVAKALTSKAKKNSKSKKSASPAQT